MSKSPADRLLDPAEWSPVDWEARGGAPEGDLPYVTHSGVLRIGGIEMECAQLSDGRRVITEDGMKAFLGENWREETLELLDRLEAAGQAPADSGNLRRSLQ